MQAELNQEEMIRRVTSSIGDIREDASVFSEETAISLEEYLTRNRNKTVAISTPYSNSTDRFMQQYMMNPTNIPEPEGDSSSAHRIAMINYQGFGNNISIPISNERIRGIGTDHNTVIVDDIYNIPTTTTSSGDWEYKKFYDEKSLENKFKEEYKLKLKLRKDLKLNKDRNIKHHSLNRYNQNGYDSYVEEIINKHFKRNTMFRSRYTKDLLSSSVERLSKELISIVFENGFFKTFEKEIKIEVVNFEYEKEQFIVTLKHMFGSTKITFVTNRNLNLLDTDSIGFNPDRRLTTYSLTIDTTITEEMPIRVNSRFSASQSELKRQASAYDSLENTIKHNPQSSTIELPTIRNGLHNMEKLISYIHSNVKFIEDVVRIYIDKEELEAFLYMSKTKLEYLSDIGKNISKDLDNATKILSNLNELIIY